MRCGNDYDQKYFWKICLNYTDIHTWCSFNAQAWQIDRFGPSFCMQKGPSFRLPVKDAVTASTFAVIGDLLAQSLQRYVSEDKGGRVDLLRVAKMGGWGLLFYGPFQHYWYRFLAAQFPGKAVGNFVAKVGVNERLPTVIAAALPSLSDLRPTDLPPGSIVYISAKMPHQNFSERIKRISCALSPMKRSERARKSLPAIARRSRPTSSSWRRSFSLLCSPGTWRSKARSTRSLPR